MTGLRAGVCLVILGTLAGGVVAGEEKVALDKLPKAVLEAVKKKFPKGKMVKAGKEKEDGKTVYEVTLEADDTTYDVTVTPDGKIDSVEKTIKATDLPAAVAGALDRKYPRAKVQKAEEISKGDKVTVYEMLIVTGDKKTLEVKFDPKGKFLGEEKKDAKDKD